MTPLQHLDALRLDRAIDQDQITMLDVVREEIRNAKAVVTRRMRNTDELIRRAELRLGLRPADTKSRDARVGNSASNAAPVFPDVNRGAG